MRQLIVFILAICAAVGALPGRNRAKVPMLDGRIVGGAVVDISEYPWTVQVYYMESYICGGTLISTTWVVTAAHCISGAIDSELSIRAGTNNLNSGGMLQPVLIYVLHPSYDEANVDYDISMLLVPAFTLGTNIKTASLTSSEPANGASVTTSGWGTTSEGGNSSSLLRAVTLSVVSRSTCNATYGGRITDRMICADGGGDGKNFCQGDDGGPLVSGSSLVGIVSWGYGCTRPSYPGVYTNVANVLSWISSNTGL